MFHIDKSDLTRPILIKVNAYGFNSNSRFYTINDFSNDFTLIPNVLKLPDVIVKNKPQMIRKIGDTLSYSVDAFAVKSDKTIGDVLKKIPGIEVTAKGQIFFNGLPINYFYIDGDNLLDDKYNIATSTIPYDLVDKIQVIEHNQHIKILEGISEGQSPALNITLKQKSRLNWINNIQLSLGNKNLYDFQLNSMVFKSKFKAINNYKMNNVGTDLAIDLVEHNQSTFESSMNFDKNVDLIDVDRSILPDIESQRILFNKSNLFSFNNLIKTKKDIDIKLSFNFLKDNISNFFSTSATTILPNDIIKYQELQDLNKFYTKKNISINLGRNSKKAFFTNTISYENTPESNISFLYFNGNQIAQKLVGQKNIFSNNFNRIYVSKFNRIIELSSYITYQKRFLGLSVFPGINKEILNNNNDYLSIKQNLKTPTFFVNNFLGFKNSSKNFFKSYKIGILYEQRQLLSSLLIQQFDSSFIDLPFAFKNDLNWNRFKLYSENEFRWKKDNFNLTFLMPISNEYISYRDTFSNQNVNSNYLLILPSLGVKLKIGKESEFSSRISYSNTLGNLTDVFYGIIMQNYRDLLSNDIPLQQTRLISANIGFSSRKTIKLFFFSCFLNYKEKQNNFIVSSVIQNSFEKRTIIPFKNKNTVFDISSNVSKFIFPIKTTLSLKYTLSLSENPIFQNNSYIIIKGLSNFISIDFRSKISSYLYLSYNFSSTNRITKTERFNIGQDFINSKSKLALELLPLNGVTIKIGSDNYQVKKNQIMQTSLYLADASLRINLNKPKMEIEFLASNLFNTKEYIQISINGNSNNINKFTLRPRFFLFKTVFNF
ncbi:MAG: hypothetical protein ACOVOY_00865 [Sediminibacterium sp.]